MSDESKERVSAKVAGGEIGDFRIADDTEHAEALAEIDRLWDLVPDTAEGANSAAGRRLTALAAAVMEYEGKRWPVDAVFDWNVNKFDPLKK